MDSKLILVVIGVIGAAFECSGEFACVDCDTNHDMKYCSDPFTSMGSAKAACEGPTCTKTKTINASGVTTFIERQCSFTQVDKDECTTVTKDGITTISCVCRSDYCNDGQMVKPTSYNVIIGVAMATVVSIAWMKQI